MESATEVLASSTTLETVERVNVRLAVLLENARCALRGERDFAAEDVRRLLEPLAEMSSLVDQWAEVLRLHPEFAPQLELYKSQLGELQTTLCQLRVMLLARQASLRTSQTHNTAVSRWVSAFRQTH
jgi:hypothetical protein